MPTYVYACSACNQTFEFDQRITEDPIKNCILCTVGTVKRVIQPVGIAFKGSGFYVNDSVATGAPKESAPKEDAPKTAEEKSIPAAPTVDSTTPAANPAPAAPTSSTKQDT